MEILIIIILLYLNFLQVLPENCYATLQACEQHSACSRLWDHFRESCKVKDHKCLMSNRRACYEAYEYLKKTPLFSCDCPRPDHSLYGLRCSGIQVLTSHNLCLMHLIRDPVTDVDTGWTPQRATEIPQTYPTAPYYGSDLRPTEAHWLRHIPSTLETYPTDRWNIETRTESYNFGNDYHQHVNTPRTTTAAANDYRTTDLNEKPKTTQMVPNNLQTKPTRKSYYYTPEIFTTTAATTERYEDFYRRRMEEYYEQMKRLYSTTIATPTTTYELDRRRYEEYYRWYYNLTTTSAATFPERTATTKQFSTSPIPDYRYHQYYNGFVATTSQSAGDYFYRVTSPKTSTSTATSSTTTITTTPTSTSTTSTTTSSTTTSVTSTYPYWAIKVEGNDQDGTTTEYTFWIQSSERKADSRKHSKSDISTTSSPRPTPFVYRKQIPPPAKADTTQEIRTRARSTTVPTTTTTQASTAKIITTTRSKSKLTTVTSTAAIISTRRTALTSSKSSPVASSTDFQLDELLLNETTGSMTTLASLELLKPQEDSPVVLTTPKPASGCLIQRIEKRGQASEMRFPLKHTARIFDTEKRVCSDWCHCFADDYLQCNRMGCLPNEFTIDCKNEAFNEITYIEFRGTCKCFGGVLICPRGEAAINVTGEFALFIGYSDKELAWLRTKVNEDFVKKQSGLEHHDPNRAIEAALNHMIDVLVEPDADGILPNCKFLASSSHADVNNLILVLKERERPRNNSMKAAEWTTPTRKCLQAVNLMELMFERGEFQAHLVPSVIKAIEIVNLINLDPDESGSLKMIFSVQIFTVSIGILIFQRLAM